MTLFYDECTVQTTIKYLMSFNISWIYCLINDVPAGVLRSRSKQRIFHRSDENERLPIQRHFINTQWKFCPIHHVIHMRIRRHWSWVRLLLNALHCWFYLKLSKMKWKTTLYQIIWQSLENKQILPKYRQIISSSTSRRRHADSMYSLDSISSSIPISHPSCNVF